ncbi:efflux RND transporter periplasmic adaptor subunit [Scatolibacter rhodanostii]|uniref:efflux RND transporter periplasmic adaptor subunit n=1 Tax=Scatolibacter rhodanostii TaxID=2014781 RepID=UPI000C088B9E|nr:efflux RND transporter periplasmic adaptor subunit [Scatolibacter rhodanostii]
MNKKHYDHPSADTTSDKKVMNKKQKIFLLAAGVLVGLALIFTGIWFFFLKDYWAMQKADPILVTSVSSLTGTDLGITGRYAGVVEPQKTISVNKDDSKTVSEILVVEGQNVNAGDPLFSYNIDEMKLTLEQDKLTVESINNTIGEYKNQISDLETERENASADNKLSYTIKIQTLELNIREQEYQASVKNKEIEKMNASIQNNVVTAPEAGIIKTINENTNNANGMMYNGGTTPTAFISILSTGEYRIKATITELQRYQVSQGQPVIIHSRINPDVTWSGSIESIDFENPVSNSDSGNYSMMYAAGDSSSSQGSSRYNFFVALDDQSVIADSKDGLDIVDNSKLIIGQHVYIEPSSGDSSAPKTGIWLPSYYLVKGDSDSFVWAQDKNQKLEKRKITLGAYDAETDLYEITDGVHRDDYLAIPSDNLKNGLPVTTDPMLGTTGDMMSPVEEQPTIDMPLAESITPEMQEKLPTVSTEEVS